jgi:hypothetical protein
MKTDFSFQSILTITLNINIPLLNNQLLYNRLYHMYSLFHKAHKDLTWSTPSSVLRQLLLYFKYNYGLHSFNEINQTSQNTN